VEEVRNEITKIMREQHHIGEGQEDDFSVITSALMQDFLDRSFRTFNVFVPLIAGTAFLISAMVILSIMQISIKGRTPEIGLRKAVGARSRDLQAQIVLEVVMVSAVASLIGLLLAQLGIAALTPVLAAKFGVRHVNPPVLVLIVAVCAAMLTGLLGGTLPARRAAKLNPVEALK
jgi:putative ABC transport system permease protein